MKVIVTGGTGFIGRALIASLLADNHRVTLITRQQNVKCPEGVRAVNWPKGEQMEGMESETWGEALEGADAAVHLAGESIAAKRWNRIQKEKIYTSRVASTRLLVSMMAKLERPPRLLVSGSAVGYYGPCGDEPVTESHGPGSNFLSRVCQAWEHEAEQARKLGIRVAVIRTGIVLGQNGGALPKMLLPFRLWIGGPLGNGRQYMPWIHLDDMVGVIRFLIGHPSCEGPFNASSPNPVTNLAFSRTLGAVMRRPSWLPVPPAALRIALGEMADALLLSGQRVLPERLLQQGYVFKYAELDSALRQVLS